MLHTKTVEPFTLELLKDLMSKDYLKQFFLVGGTALSLQIGHRISVDLDLFTDKDYSTDELIPLLLKDYSVTPILQHPQTLICKINGVKVDFIRFRYKTIRPVIEEKGIRMLSVDDIAPMKLDAITGRGRKKDFYDLFFLIKRYSIEQLLNLYLEKYPHQTTFHVARSMSYFVDAEKDADPIVFQKNITWQKVKDGIVEEIRKL